MISLDLKQKMRLGSVIPTDLSITYRAGSMIPSDPRSGSVGSDLRSIFSDPCTCLIPTSTENINNEPDQKHQQCRHLMPNPEAWLWDRTTDPDAFHYQCQVWKMKLKLMDCQTVIVQSKLLLLSYLAYFLGCDMPGLKQPSEQVSN